MTKWMVAFLLCAGGVGAAVDPWVRLTAPEGETAASAKPDIGMVVAGYVDRETLRVTLDGADVTDFIEIGPDSIVLSCPVPLANGTHELVVTGMDAKQIPVPPFRKTLTVRVRGKREADASASLTESYQRELHRKNLPEQPTTSSSTLTSTAGFRTDHSRQTLEVATLYSYPAPYPPSNRDFDLSQATYRYGYNRESWKMNLTLGQVMLDDSPFTVSGYATRGGLLSFETGAGDLSFFSLDTRRPYGFQGGVGPGADTGDHINGFRLQSKSLGGFQLYTTYLEGAEAAAGSFNTASQAEAVGARVAALGARFASGGTSAVVEFGQSRPVDVGGADKPGAYRFQLNSRFERVTLDLSHRRVEKDFQSPGVPYLATDREESLGSVQYSHAGTSWGIVLGHQRDNLSGESLFPGLTQWRSGLTFGRALHPTTQLNVSYTWSLQTSGSGDSTFQQDLAGHQAMVGLQWRRAIHSLQLNTTMSKLDDRTALNGDSDSRGCQAAYMVSPSSWLDVSASAQWNRSQSAMMEEALLQTTYNLDVRTRLWGNRLSVDLGGSLNTSEQPAGAADMENAAYRLRLAVNPWGSALGWVQNTFSLDFRLARTTGFGAAQTNRQVLLSANLSLTGRTAYVR